MRKCIVVYTVGYAGITIGEESRYHNYCRRTKQGLNQYTQKSKAKSETSGDKVDLLLLRDQERRSYKIPGALSRKTRLRLGRTDADLHAAFAIQPLKWHGPQYNILYLLYNVTLERELR